MTHETRALLSELEKFCSEKVNFRLYDERRSMPPQLLLKLGQLKIFGMQIPKRYGGLELGHQESFELIAGIGKIDLTLGAWIGQNNSLGIRPLVGYGSLEQKEKYLPALAKGEKLISFAATDPQSGSNVSGMTAVLKKEIGFYRLSGEKWFVGNALWADLYCVLSKYQNESGLASGMSLCLVESSNPGLKIEEELLTMGLRSSVQNIIRFVDAKILPEEIVGDPTRGGLVAAETMSLTRVGIGALALGGLVRCIEIGTEYSRTRTISTGLLGNNTWTQNVLFGIEQKKNILYSMVSWIAEQLDQGFTLPDEFFMAAKLSGSEFLWEAADEVMQLQGGRGYLESNPTAQLLRDARALRILEGPSEALWYHLGLLSRRTKKIENYFQRHHDFEFMELLRTWVKRLEGEEFGNIKETDEGLLVFKGKIYSLALLCFSTSMAKLWETQAKALALTWLKNQADLVIQEAHFFAKAKNNFKFNNSEMNQVQSKSSKVKPEVYLKEE
jgi:alkylation response protein AidB-like acyl-CoA dehydrogenase